MMSNCTAIRQGASAKSWLVRLYLSPGHSATVHPPGKHIDPPVPGPTHRTAPAADYKPVSQKSQLLKK